MSGWCDAACLHACSLSPTDRHSPTKLPRKPVTRGPRANMAAAAAAAAAAGGAHERADKGVTRVGVTGGRACGFGRTGKVEFRRAGRISVTANTQTDGHPVGLYTFRKIRFRRLPGARV